LIDFDRLIDSECGQNPPAIGGGRVGADGRRILTLLHFSTPYLVSPRYRLETMIAESGDSGEDPSNSAAALLQVVTTSEPKPNRLRRMVAALLAVLVFTSMLLWLFCEPFRVWSGMRIEQLFGEYPCWQVQARWIPLTGAYHDQLVQGYGVLGPCDATAAQICADLNGKGLFDGFGRPWEWCTSEDRSWALIYSLGPAGKHPNFAWLFGLECGMGLLVDESGYYEVRDEEHLSRVLGELGVYPSN
jgi:hypothetical protein